MDPDEIFTPDSCFDCPFADRCNQDEENCQFEELTNDALADIADHLYEQEKDRMIDAGLRRMERLEAEDIQHNAFVSYF